MTRVRRTAADLSIEWAFRSGWTAARFVPRSISARGFDQLADKLWRGRGPGVLQLEHNLARVQPECSAPELQEMSKLALRSYMRYWRETFEVPHWPQGYVREAFVMENPEVVDAALDAGRGVILVSTHSGSWDLAGAWAADRYGGVTTVAERLKPEGLYRQFVKHRVSFGAEIFPTGTPHVLDTLAERLAAGGVVALMGDRDISRRGIAVPLFGELASLPAGPARLALNSGAPLLQVSLWYSPDGRAHGRVDQQITVPDAGDLTTRVETTVASLARAFESSLRTHTIDWHMMQPVWVKDLDARRKPQGEPAKA